MLSSGEAEYLYQFVRLQLNWNGVDLSYYITYTTVVTLLGRNVKEWSVSVRKSLILVWVIFTGTLLMVSVFSKVFNMSDALIGLIASTFSLVSKPFLAFSRTTLAYYIGSTIDLFVSTRILTLRSISSTMVHPDEISKGGGTRVVLEDEI